LERDYWLSLINFTTSASRTMVSIPSPLSVCRVGNCFKMIRINTKFYITKMVNNLSLKYFSFFKGVNNSMSNSSLAIPFYASITRLMNRTRPNVTAISINSMASKWIHSNRARWSAICKTSNTFSPTTIGFNTMVFVKIFNRFILFTLAA